MDRKKVTAEKDVFTVSISTSGAPLYKRGYKKVLGDAPLRENYAAALVLISRWDRKSTLIDPFCGTGTICIEAALIATNTPPGIFRNFAFETWSIHSKQLWEKVKEEAKNKRKECQVEILGFDKNKKAKIAAVKNLSSLDIKDCVFFKEASFPKIKRDQVWIVSNPPYGKRLPKKEAEEAYIKLGKWIKKNFSSAFVTLLSPYRKLALFTGLPLKKITTFVNSGIRVGIYRCFFDNT